MKVLALDAGKNSCCGFLLSELPKSIKSAWEKFRKDKSRFLHLTTNKAGLELLRQILPDIIVLEPTGVHYTEFWRIAAEQLGIEVLWVGHSEISNYRKSHRLPNKSDRADSFAIACYSLEHLNDPQYFLSFNPEVRRLKELVLELESLNRVQNPLINRAKLQLAHEWPEAANKTSNTQDGPGALWRYLAHGDSKYWESQRKKSVALALNVEISQFTVDHAQAIYEIQEREHETLKEVRRFLDKREFRTYNQILDQMGMTLRAKAWVITKIYPFEQFRKIDEDGVIKWDKGAFKLRLGMGRILHQSGDDIKWIMGGSKHVRTQLSLWINQSVAKQNPNCRPVRVPLGKELCDYYDSVTAEIGREKTGVIRNMRACSKATRILFREFVKNWAGQ